MWKMLTDIPIEEQDPTVVAYVVMHNGPEKEENLQSKW